MTAVEIELKTCEQKKTNGLTINNAHEETKMEPIEEANLKIIDTDIGYCRYGKGPVNFLFICGGVGPFLRPQILNSPPPSSLWQAVTKKIIRSVYCVPLTPTLPP